MSKKLDLVGLKFGRLLVIKESGSKQGHSMFICKCDCGADTKNTGKNLISGNSKSCGCYARESTKLRESTHGLSKTRIYHIFCGIKARCENPNNTRYPYYGGRGIKCFWPTFEKFYKDMGATYNDKLTIERINVNGDYTKDNCKWIEFKYQGSNKRNNIKYNGVTMAQAARNLGASDWAIGRRIERGWTIERAFSTPLLRNYKHKVL